MTTYTQTMIHSKVAKLDKNDKSFGKVVKGGSFCQPALFNQTLRNDKPSEDSVLQRQIRKQYQILPKTRTNIGRKMLKKSIPSLTKGEQIILMQSSIFPPIYFKKTSMRNVLKQFSFPQNVRALAPNDSRTTLIFQIISNLFNEITFYVFNILIGENMITQSYYVFFSDSQTIPFTKCCNAPVYVQLMNNGSGKILCNSQTCQHSTLAQFLINFQDGKKLWKDITYFQQASSKDTLLRYKISKFISSGKYKKISLVDTVQDTSKQIVELFYKSKKNPKLQPQEQFDDNAFLTAGKDNYRSLVQSNQNQNEQDNTMSGPIKPLTAEQLYDTNDSDVDILKMKIYYLTRNEKDLSKKLSKQIVRNGKVFHSDFDMIKKIDQIMLNKRNSKATRISFPKVMEQYRITKYRQSKSKSMYQKEDSFNNKSHQNVSLLGR